MKKIVILLLLVFIVFASGCTSNNSLYEFQIGNHIYVFSQNIYDSIKVPLNNRAELKKLVWNSSEIDIVFRGGTNDDPHFSVIGFNMVSKLSTYFSSLNITKKFTAKEISNETFANTTILMVGPSTGAKTTSVNVSGNMIVLQGTSYDDLARASEKLVIVILDIDKRLNELRSK